MQQPVFLPEKPTPVPRRLPDATGSPVLNDNPFECFWGASWGCVAHLRSRGFCVPKTPNGTAGSLPVRSAELPPIGQEVTCISRESEAGHVGRCVYDGETLKYTVNSTGQYPVPLNLYKGYY